MVCPEGRKAVNLSKILLDVAVPCRLWPYWNPFKAVAILFTIGPFSCDICRPLRSFSSDGPPPACNTLHASVTIRPSVRGILQKLNQSGTYSLKRLCPFWALNTWYFMGYAYLHGTLFCAYERCIFHMEDVRQA